MPRAAQFGMVARVLVIDDDEPIRTAVYEYFCDNGWLADVAGEREEAEALMLYVPYDLIVTDLSLSKLGWEGFDLLRFTAGLERKPKVIVLSGYAGPDHQLLAQGCGADVYLSKPVKLAELGQAARRLVGVPG